MIMNNVGAGFCFEQAEPNSNKELEKWLHEAFKEKIAFGILQNTYNSNIKNFDINIVVTGINSEMSKLLKSQSIS